MQFLYYLDKVYSEIVKMPGMEVRLCGVAGYRRRAGALSTPHYWILFHSFSKVDALSVGTQEALVAAKKPQIQIFDEPVGSVSKNRCHGLAGFNKVSRTTTTRFLIVDLNI